MSVYELIANRRSIRKFKNDPIPQETLQKILQAGILAPSGMNRQTWNFYVVQGSRRDEMTACLSEGLEKHRAAGEVVTGAKHSFEVMAQAPVNIFIYRPNRPAHWLPGSAADTNRDLVDVQSVGAAIQNMVLAAQELGIGSLWVCDVFDAFDEISRWIGESTQLIAALCLGYADESPEARKRRPFDEVVHWL